jgi:CRISPR-associated protein Cmr2
VIIRGDADNVGKLNRGEIPIERYRELFEKLKEEAKEKDVEGLPDAYDKLSEVIQSLDHVLVTPTYYAALSMALMIMALRDIQTTNYRYKPLISGLIFSGGDDVLALAPVEYALRIVRDLRHNYWGYENGFHKLNNYYWATPKVEGFGRSFSLRFVNIMDNMNEEISKAHEKLEEVSKNASWRIHGQALEKDTLTISDSRTSVTAAIPLTNVSIEVNKMLDLLNVLFLLRVSGVLSSNLPEDYEKYSEAVKAMDCTSELLHNFWKYLINRNVLIRREEYREQIVRELTEKLKEYDVDFCIKRESEGTDILHELINAYAILRGYP